MTSAATDPATGLPVEALPYAPDARVYDEMLATSGAPSWLDELDLRVAPPHLHMGTHATTHERWLLADAARDMELAIRSRLLDERRDLVFGCAPHADGAAAATLDLVLAWLSERGIDHPHPDPDEHPLVAAGRLVQEDLCLMIRRDGAWHLDAGVLCFPTLWQLHDRLGLPTPRVHERVAHYDEIEPKVDRFFDRLPPDRVVWRRNFSVKPYPHLHVPTVKSEMPRGGHHVAPDGSPYWIRSERQTLRRLPGHEAIVFAIRIQTVRAGAMRRRPDVAAAMAAHIRSWDQPTRDYKFAGSDLFVAFVGWLDSIAASAPD
jgi:dimethylamine monooxygenase subunit A